MKIRRLLSILLLGSLGWATSSNITNVATSTDEVVGPKCEELEKLFFRQRGPVSIFSKARSVSVLHGARAPSRAAGALLAAVLRHGLRYSRVALRPGPRTLCELASTYPDLRHDDADYDELVLHVGAEWMQQEDRTCEALSRCGPRDLCGAAGPRFNVMGPPPAPMTLRLHARLSPTAWTDPACAGADAWPFYANVSALTRCGFEKYLPAGLQILGDIPTVACSTTPNECIPVLTPPDWNTSHVTAQKLAARFNDSLLHLRIIPLADDVTLRRLLHNQSLANSSVLFLDYELWADAHDSAMRVLRVQSPPPEMAPVEALRIADAYYLRQFAPKILDAFSHFAVHPHELRDVLEREANGLHIEEAACDHAYRNINRFDEWRNASGPILWAYVLLCDDPDFENYKRVCDKIGPIMNLTNSIQVSVKPVNCEDDNDLNQKLIDMMQDLRYVRLIGAVGVGAGAAASAHLANMRQTQLVLYDVPPGAAKLGTAARVVAGRADQLVRATHHFFSINGWRRIAIISEKSALASDFVSLLAKDGTLALGMRSLLSVNNEEAANALQSLQHENARVFFINTGPVAASILLCEALRLGLTPDKGYAWIVREWRSWSCELENGRMEHFTVSYWWRGGDDSALPKGSGSALLRRALDELWPGRPWPMLAAPLADALILLDRVTNVGLRVHPMRRYDLHGSNATSDFAESFSDSEKPTGVVQELPALDAPLVFVDAWRGDARWPHALWQLRGYNVYSLKKFNTGSADSTPTWDGTTRCFTKRTGDAFSPTCLDGAAAAAAVVVAATPAVVWLAARARAARLAARERALRVRLVARCERTAAALAAHLVPRAAVQLHEELGAGHFGRVRRGTLTLPHCAPVPVAVKALRSEASAAEEAEFLREACALAALGAHAHVVRLRGVCAADGPPLLLMEHALFGDLARYLRERSHLARPTDDELEHDAADTEDAEARYVTARELTRLAREASAALAHVARARLVHRDVRAANCLVDDTRTLKLADFGMARAITPGAGGEAGAEVDVQEQDEEYVYVCRRRGVFPVPWMAPESVSRGEFSRASDVWALGVLLLEAATLGARPFAAWRLPRALRHVRAGGHPPLPSDASYHTCEIIEMCWQRAPDARPSAAAVLDYLTRHPTALRPALRPAWPASDDGGAGHGDSGFGERDAALESDPHITTF